MSDDVDVSDFIKRQYEECDGWGCKAVDFRKEFFAWRGKGMGRNKFYSELRGAGIVVEKGTGGFIRLYGLRKKTI